VAIEKGRTLARHHDVEGVTWRIGDIQAIDAPAASFDAVLSCETIEHVPNPALAIRALARVLRPGGTLFLTFPNYLGSYGLYRAYLRITGRRFSEVGQPINNFTTLPQVKHWVRRVGLSIEKVVGVGHYAFWPGSPPRRLHSLDYPALTAVALHTHLVAVKDSRA
jgi:2-polyprenyl-3-methyl-5-hydroxy-6-metoxy-1,4-benzoquinol methylase